MKPFIKYIVFAIFLLAVIGMAIKRTIGQPTAVLEKGCFVHDTPIDTTQKSIVFPRSAGHLLSYTKEGKALLTSITANFTRPIPMKEWLELDRKPNKQIAIRSTLIETRGTVTTKGDTLVFQSDKPGHNKTFLMERKNRIISNLREIATNDNYVIGNCDPNL